MVWVGRQAASDMKDVQSEGYTVAREDLFDWADTLLARGQFIHRPHREKIFHCTGHQRTLCPFSSSPTEKMFTNGAIPVKDSDAVSRSVQERELKSSFDSRMGGFTCQSKILAQAHHPHFAQLSLSR